MHNSNAASKAGPPAWTALFSFILQSCTCRPNDHILCQPTDLLCASSSRTHTSSAPHVLRADQGEGELANPERIAGDIRWHFKGRRAQGESRWRFSRWSDNGVEKVPLTCLKHIRTRGVFSGLTHLWALPEKDQTPVVDSGTTWTSARL